MQEKVCGEKEKVCGERERVERKRKCVCGEKEWGERESVWREIECVERDRVCEKRKWGFESCGERERPICRQAFFSCVHVVKTSNTNMRDDLFRAITEQMKHKLLIQLLTNPNVDLSSFPELNKSFTTFVDNKSVFGAEDFWKNKLYELIENDFKTSNLKDILWEYLVVDEQEYECKAESQVAESQVAESQVAESGGSSGSNAVVDASTPPVKVQRTPERPGPSHRHKSCSQPDFKVNDDLFFEIPRMNFIGRKHNVTYDGFDEPGGTSESATSKTTLFVNLDLFSNSDMVKDMTDDLVAHIEERLDLKGLTRIDFQDDGKVLHELLTIDSSNEIVSPDDDLKGKYFMYVLLYYEKAGTFTLRMHEYRRKFDWYSKHGVILHTTDEYNYVVVCAGIFKWEDTFIYIDNMSGTLAPEIEQLKAAKMILQKAFGKRVFTCTGEEAYRYLREDDNIIKTLIEQHPDFR